MTGGVASLHNRDRSLGAIIVFVACAHTLFLMFLIFNPSFQTMPLQAPRRVIVKTISLKEETSKPTSATPVAKSAPPAPQNNTKRDTPKVQAKPSPKAKKTEKIEKTAVSQESISKIQQSLSKINTKSLKDMPVVEMPAPVTTLEVDSLPESGAAASSMEGHYRDELARRLKMFLTLPERGNVVIELTVNRAGSVVRLNVVSSASQANKKYTEQNVPALTFPPFGAFFGGESQHTFKIELRSE